MECLLQAFDIISGLTGLVESLVSWFRVGEP